MTTSQMEQVKATVPVLREHGVLLTTHFYKRMFEHNPELKHMFNMGNQQNQKQQTALALAVLAYAEHIEDPSVLMPAVNGIGHKHTSLDVRPEHYAIVGRHLIASIGEVLGAAATPELIEAWTAAYQQLASLMSGHEQNLYNARTAAPGGWAGWRPFLVKRKVAESTEITSFYLYPSDGGPIAAFTPGQFISVRVFLPALQLMQPRQYSISSAPNGEFYRISVKREGGSAQPEGLVSNHLHAHVAEGDVLELSAPAGTFVLGDTPAPKVFISGGVGQTPLMAMLENLLMKKGPALPAITWIHGCRSEAVHAFRSRISEIMGTEPGLDLHIFYDDCPVPGERQYTGRVELDAVPPSALQSGAEYYLCGPAPFISKHYQYLVSKGVPAAAIHFEEFGPASLQLN